MRAFRASFLFWTALFLSARVIAGPLESHLPKTRVPVPELWKTLDRILENSKFSAAGSLKVSARGKPFLANVFHFEFFNADGGNLLTFDSEGLDIYNLSSEFPDWATAFVGAILSPQTGNPVEIPLLKRLIEVGFARGKWLELGLGSHGMNLVLILNAHIPAEAKRGVFLLQGNVPEERKQERLALAQMDDGRMSRYLALNQQGDEASDLSEGENFYLRAVGELVPYPSLSWSIARDGEIDFVSHKGLGTISRDGTFYVLQGSSSKRGHSLISSPVHAFGLAYDGAHPFSVAGETLEFLRYFSDELKIYLRDCRDRVTAPLSLLTTLPARISCPEAMLQIDAALSK
jgi:hypothetical protein